MKTWQRVFMILTLLSWGALAQTSDPNGCKAKGYDVSLVDQWCSVTYIFPWFAAQGDPASTNQENSLGWKTWITATNLVTGYSPTSTDGVGVSLYFLKPTGGKMGQRVWYTVRNDVPEGIMIHSGGMYAGETMEFHITAAASDAFTVASGLATGSVMVEFASSHPADLDLQGKLELMFVQVDEHGGVKNIGSVLPTKLSEAPKKVMTQVVITPSAAREGNPMPEVPAFAVMNLADTSQVITATLENKSGVVATKQLTLAPWATVGQAVEDLFGLSTFDTTDKLWVGRLTFSSAGPLAAISLQFGGTGMGSRTVWPLN